MNAPSRQRPTIELRLEGPAVPGRIRVDALTSIVKELQTALRRQLGARRRAGGRFPMEVEKACSLDLVGFTTGSAILTLELAGSTEPTGDEQGARAAIDMLAAMQRAESGAPGWEAGLPASILDGWEALAKSIGDGITSLDIALLDAGHRQSVHLTAAFRRHVREATQRQAEVGDGSLVGVLWECDWKQHTAQLEQADGCRVHLCLSAGLDEIATALRRELVQVTGKIERQDSRPVRATVVHIARATQRVGESDARYGSFWENLSVEQLARRQGVGPVTDLDALAGDWPAGESIDEFLAMVREVRGG